MKLKHIFQTFLLIFPLGIFAQGLLNNGTDINIVSGTYINVKNAGFSNKLVNTTISNAGTITLNGFLNNFGTITGLLILDGSSNSNARLGSVENIEVNTSGNITVLDDCSISKRLKISSGGDFNTNSQTVTLLSDANGTALVHHDGGTTTGNFEVQRYISTGSGHHFLTSPVSNATINELGDDFNLNLSFSNPNIYYYDETSTGTTASLRWASPATSSFSMTPGMGFACWFKASGGETVEITGR